jgi:hypothetical protein
MIQELMAQALIMHDFLASGLRALIRGGFLSSCSLFGAGTVMSVDPNSDAGQLNGRATVGVARTPLQVNPASNS